MIAHNPYSAPNAGDDEEPYDEADETDFDDLAKPGVVTYFVVYCVVGALMGAFLVVLFSVMIVVAHNMPEKEPGQRLSMTVGSAVYIIGGLFLALPLTAAPFLPRKPWVWVFDLVLICLGFATCCLPASIPLLIFWIRPEVQAYYGKE